MWSNLYKTLRDCKGQYLISIRPRENEFVSLLHDVGFSSVDTHQTSSNMRPHSTCL